MKTKNLLPNPTTQSQNVTFCVTIQRNTNSVRLTSICNCLPVLQMCISRPCSR